MGSPFNQAEEIVKLIYVCCGLRLVFVRADFCFVEDEFGFLSCFVFIGSF